MTKLVGGTKPVLMTNQLLNLWGLENAAPSGAASASSFTMTSGQLKWAFTGTGFAAYTLGFPTQGFITGITYSSGGVVITRLTNMHADVGQFAVDMANQNFGDNGMMGHLFAGADAITGSVKSDVLFGFDGADVIHGGAGNDRISGLRAEGGPHDNLIDKLFGDDGNDQLTLDRGVADGGAGSDFLQLVRSGNTNDTLDMTKAVGAVGSKLGDGTIVRNMETVAFSAGGGDDTLIISAFGRYNQSYFDGGDGNDTLIANLSYLTTSLHLHLPADHAVGLFANYDIEHIERLEITGGSAADEFYGGLLNDVLNGGGGNDTLWGERGNDILNGGAGIDSMGGGPGNDTFYVDSPFDNASELAFTGTANSVIATVSYVLPANVEKLTLQGLSAVTATGNASDNILTGNGLANTLNGMAGADTMTGAGGADTYIVDNINEHVIEAANQGADTIQTSVAFTLAANVENGVLLGSDAIGLAGNSLNNVLTGNSAANTLAGGGGADAFVFNTALDGSNIDTIQDFGVADDTIRLSASIFAGLTAGALAAEVFTTGAAATDADQRIIYDNTTGALYFDADGDGAGAPIQFATLTAWLTLSEAQFLVI